jgi:hypothetical protein
MKKGKNSQIKEGGGVVVDPVERWRGSGAWRPWTEAGRRSLYGGSVTGRRCGLLTSTRGALGWGGSTTATLVARTGRRVCRHYLTNPSSKKKRVEGGWGGGGDRGRGGRDEPLLSSSPPARRGRTNGGVAFRGRKARCAAVARVSQSRRAVVRIILFEIIMP